MRAHVVLHSCAKILAQADTTFSQRKVRVLEHGVCPIRELCLWAQATLLSTVKMPVTVQPPFSS